MENKLKNIIIILLALVVVILAVFLILSKDKKEKIVNDEIKGEVVLMDLEKKIRTEASEWSNNWIKENTGSDLSMFIKSQDVGSITEIEYPYDFKENKSDLREKKSYYIYSPDKTKILDAHGYVELEEKDGKIIEGYDVDSRVLLIDVKTNKFKQILTCGTPCGFNDAVWIDDNSFVVLGQSRGSKKVDECKIYEECQSPLLYVFDLKNNKYTSYHGSERLLVTEKEEISTNTDTYTYKDHGFTMELPKGYIPHEEESEGGPAIMIKLPVGGLAYVTDATFWEKYNISPNSYIKDEKIGDTIFKIYNYENTKVYWFKKGNVGYEFSVVKFSTIKDTTELENLIKTFKFVGWN
jgi:hypothetical protein